MALGHGTQIEQRLMARFRATDGRSSGGDADVLARRSTADVLDAAHRRRSVRREQEERDVEAA